MKAQPPTWAAAAAASDGWRENVFPNYGRGRKLAGVRGLGAGRHGHPEIWRLGTDVQPQCQSGRGGTHTQPVQMWNANCCGSKLWQWLTLISPGLPLQTAKPLDKPQHQLIWSLLHVLFWGRGFSELQSFCLLQQLLRFTVLHLCTRNCETLLPCFALLALCVKFCRRKDNLMDVCSVSVVCAATCVCTATIFFVCTVCLQLFGQRTFFGYMYRCAGDKRRQLNVIDGRQSY